MKLETRNTRPELLICLLLVAAILVVYWQIRNHEFVSYDDGLYVTENPYVRAGLTPESISWAFTATHSSNWHPVTWLSHMLDIELYGMNSGQHLMTNMLFHIANTLLLFSVLRRMTGGSEARGQRSEDPLTSSLTSCGFVAALFALHPLHVESVAWVAERKDVLSTFFMMLTMQSYIRYAKQPGIGTYLPVFLFFALGLMAKPMLVTLPFVMLLLDYWPLHRFYKNSDIHESGDSGINSSIPQFLNLSIFYEKIPFFALTAASCVITFLVQKSGGSVGALDILPLDVRIANALVSYICYIGKMIWPLHLAVLYPHPRIIPAWQIAGACLILVSVSLLVVRNMRQRPCLAVGWFWYIGTLVPAIGLVQVGRQAMADRYTYIPLIGLFIMVAWGIPEILSGWRYRNRLLTPFAVVILLALTTISWKQAQYWKNSITLYEHTLCVTTDNDTIHYNMGNALSARGKYDKAIWHYAEALRLFPDAEKYNNLGLALFRKGNIDEAVKCYAEALKIYPDSDEAHNNLGNAFAARGKLDKSVFHYSRALQISPENANVHNNLGLALIQKGDIDGAVTHFQEALRIKSDYKEAYNNLGRTHAIKRKIDEAVQKIQESLKIDPEDIMLSEKLEDIYKSRRELDDAAEQYHKALTPQPGYTREALNIDNYVKVYEIRKEYDVISSLLKKLTELEPDSEQAYYTVACVFARQHKTEKSVEWLKKAVRKGYDNWEALKNDRNLENIRNTPYYKSLINEQRTFSVD